MCDHVRNLRCLEWALGHFRSANSHILLDLSNGTSGVQTLGACPCAVENGVAAVQRKRVLELLATLGAMRITRVSHPAVCLHQDSRAKVRIAIPPVRGAGCGAAGTQNAFVETVQVSAFLRALEVFTATRRRASRLQVWLNAAVLLVELRQVRNEVLDDVSVRQGVNVALRRILVNTAQAGKRVHTINVHGTASADALTAGASEGQRRVLLVLDLKKRVKHHGTCLVQIELVRLHPRLLRRLLRVLLC